MHSQFDVNIIHTLSCTRSDIIYLLVSNFQYDSGEPSCTLYFLAFLIRLSSFALDIFFLLERSWNFTKCTTKIIAVFRSVATLIAVSFHASHIIHAIIRKEITVDAICPRRAMAGRVTERSTP